MIPTSWLQSTGDIYKRNAVACLYRAVTVRRFVRTSCTYKSLLFYCDFDKHSFTIVAKLNSIGSMVSSVTLINTLSLMKPNDIFPLYCHFYMIYLNFFFQELMCLIQHYL